MSASDFAAFDFGDSWNVLLGKNAPQPQVALDHALAGALVPCPRPGQQLALFLL